MNTGTDEVSDERKLVIVSETCTKINKTDQKQHVSCSAFDLTSSLENDNEDDNDGKPKTKTLSARSPVRERIRMVTRGTVQGEKRKVVKVAPEDVDRYKFNHPDAAVNNTTPPVESPEDELIAVEDEEEPDSEAYEEEEEDDEVPDIRDLLKGCKKKKKQPEVEEVEKDDETTEDVSEESEEEESESEPESEPELEPEPGPVPAPSTTESPSRSPRKVASIRQSSRQSAPFRPGQVPETHQQKVLNGELQVKAKVTMKTSRIYEN